LCHEGNVIPYSRGAPERPLRDSELELLHYGIGDWYSIASRGREPHGRNRIPDSKGEQWMRRAYDEKRFPPRPTVGADGELSLHPSRLAAKFGAGWILWTTIA
jgi:hypothetical protein